MISASTFLDAAGRLHTYLVQNYWNGQSLAGPDSGIRLNARFGRFIKSYLPFVPWADTYSYMQTQGYWIMSNWIIHDLLHYPAASALAMSATAYVLNTQRREGYWDYPNPEWKGRIATVEGCFAAMGLLESYRRTQRTALLEGATRWHRFLVEEIGFQQTNGLLAINYFSNVQGTMVPNNTTLVLMNMAHLADAGGDDRYRSTCGPMVAWLNTVQMESGELPYAVKNTSVPDRPHFLCYQYNAFEFLDLVDYYQLTGDRAIMPVLERLAGYLATGFTAAGTARYDCMHNQPEIVYYTVALARALSQATLMGIGDFRALTEQAYQWVLSMQRTDGGFKFFSRRNYGMLQDRRSYPRNLAMMLYHLLTEARAQQIGTEATISPEPARATVL